MIYPTLKEADSYSKDKQIKEMKFLYNFMMHIHRITPRYSQQSIKVVKNAKN